MSTVAYQSLRMSYVAHIVADAHSDTDDMTKDGTHGNPHDGPRER